ncbi:hypothetical protein Micbo1qcDRAFT_154692 [Microdochium bolleyi]|uniref:BZIP domain-containing protein n=1 Tax=Microdochium bolleyi TaxID=196109 RepID=A0A136IJF3_9PEZI|nr:hypothetical protein Micbo1qcDRAFT_154692 [Microdochium bolleyi]
MSRFPARQSSANQNAARLRDNQRRHRARVKAHTAELEAQLAETKARLDAALDEIAHLTSEVESLSRGLVTERNVPRALPTVRASSPAAAAHLPSVFGPPIRDESPRPHCSGNCNQDQTHVDGEAHATQPDILVVMMSGRDCKDLPAPQSGESTAPCIDAYKVIEQQNFSGLDVVEITRWLKPGFRKAAEKGGGCRVDTQLLFALLDHISSTDGL